MIEKRTCPECGHDAYLSNDGEIYECTNPECLYAWDPDNRKQKRKISSTRQLC